MALFFRIKELICACTLKLSSLKSHYKACLNAIDKYLVNRLKAQEEELLIFTHAKGVWRGVSGVSGNPL